MPRIVIDIQKGLFEVEGDEKFVERIYNDFRDSLLKKLPVHADAIQEEAGSVQSVTTEPPKKTRRRAKAGGPSCATRIKLLKDEAFFVEPRSTGDVKSKLREKGSTYESKNVSAALNDLIKSGELRRFDEGGWQYQNP